MLFSMSSDEETSSRDRSDGDFNPIAKPKKTTVAKKQKPPSNSAPTTLDQNSSMADAISSDTISSQLSRQQATDVASTSHLPKKTVEEQYRKLTQLQHVLLRPDTYVGSVEPTTETLWVYDDGDVGMNYRPVTYVPGFYKIFDEILVNAADNKIRDPSMDSLKVTIDRTQNVISVWNNGGGIPIQIHEVEGVYVPELIFGHLLTSSNYDDNEKKVTGGRNGYGAKLCNIFSTEFIVETADKASGKKFRQVFSNNMSHRQPPVITANTHQEEYTKITFKPDLSKFHLTDIDADHEALLKKRVFDMAGTVKNTKVFLNGERLKIKSFKEYIQLYLQPKQQPPSATTSESQMIDANEDASAPAVAVLAALPPPPLIHEIVNDRWEIAVTMSDGQFQHVSFVNQVSTTKGGTHVSFVVDPLVAKIVDAVNKKNKSGAPVKPFQVRNQLMVFVNCLIENPSFDSQTKENMTLRASAFGSKCDVSEEFIKRLLKCGILETVLQQQQQRQQQQLKKSDGAKTSRLQGITKLDDANKAGTREASRCTLILTEGDSAKALAVSGLSVVGRDYYGVFPLRGKLLNVREASHKQIMENQEINHVKQILGLQHGKVYTSVDSLRYGHLMIMTDQDHDGSHIKGLLINFLDYFWPSLLQVPHFLQEFITPIVKATAKKQAQRAISAAETVAFFTMPEYEQWKAATELRAATSLYTIKYYKGLGTSTAAEAKEYFSNLGHHVKDFGVCAQEDRSAIDLAFSKKKADDRKEWLRQYVPGTFMDHSKRVIPVTEFVHQELILFSRADNIRSIPSLVDGLKPGQRKILFSCFKRNLRGDIKVAQLAGYVSEHSAYHHGEQSLCATIVNMAQNFVGANNMHLLEPQGQFGTRIQGGKDAASARYIFTALHPLTRRVFHADDDRLLDYLNEDGQQIEPTFYVPILPMVLVNGSEGIGTGWATSIPNYHPRDIVRYLKYLLHTQSSDDVIPTIYGDAVPGALHPWYRGFTGTLESIAADKYRVTGCWRVLADGSLEVRELPVGVWTQSYKEFLESLMIKSETLPKPWIADFKEYHTDTTVHFTIFLTEEGKAQLRPSTMAESDPTGSPVAYSDELIEKKLKLSTTLSTSNMVVFDSEGRIKKYATPEEIVRDFYALRIDYYGRRKAAMVAALMDRATMLTNQLRFISDVIQGQLVVHNKKRDVLLQELKEKGFAERQSSKQEQEHTDDQSVTTGESDLTTAAVKSTGVASLASRYAYLLSMPMWSLTEEKVTQLRADKEKAVQLLEELQATSPATLWIRDLDAFLEAWTPLEEGSGDQMDRPIKQQQTVTSNAHPAAVKAPRKTSNTAANKKKTAVSVEVVETVASEPVIPTSVTNVDVSTVKTKKPLASRTTTSTTTAVRKSKTATVILSSSEEDDDVEMAPVVTMATGRRPQRQVKEATLKKMSDAMKHGSAEDDDDGDEADGTLSSTEDDAATFESSSSMDEEDSYEEEDDEEVEEDEGSDFESSDEKPKAKTQRAKQTATKKVAGLTAARDENTDAQQRRSQPTTKKTTAPKAGNTARRDDVFASLANRLQSKLSLDQSKE